MVTTKEIVAYIDNQLDELTARPEAMVGRIAAAEQTVITLLELRAFAVRSHVQPMVEHSYYGTRVLGFRTWQTFAEGLSPYDAKVALADFVRAVRGMMDTP